MSDPQRLIDDPGVSQLGRALLSSTNDDGPSSESRKATARRLGLAVGAASAVSGGATATGGALWWKLVTVAVILGGATIGLVVHDRGESRGSAVAEPAPQRVPAPLPPPPAPQAVVVPVAPPITPAPSQPNRPAASHVRVAVDKPAVSNERAPAAPPLAPEPPPPPPLPEVAPPPPLEPAVAPEPPPAPQQVDARRLAAEVALLDRARAAVAAKDITTALALVDEHRRTFADGSLVAEAELLRIEALVAGGRTSEAAEAGQEFLDRFPHSPLVRRARSLISGLRK